MNHRELKLPIVALVLASITSVGALVARCFLSWNFHFLYLAGNLFLACMPLAFAFGLSRACTAGSGRAKKSALFIGWLLFFPNAPYIVTDLVHLKSRLHPQFWTDLGLLVLFAWCGAYAGFLSLYVLQQLVIQRRGKLVGWGFVFAIALLTGVGIYLGRFERWNSWDIVVNPAGVLNDAARLVGEAIQFGRPARFVALFGSVVFIGHVTLYSLVSARQVATECCESLRVDRA